jgi:hypothetical protein
LKLRLISDSIFDYLGCKQQPTIDESGAEKNERVCQNSEKSAPLRSLVVEYTTCALAENGDEHNAGECDRVD